MKCGDVVIAIGEIKGITPDGEYAVSFNDYTTFKWMRGEELLPVDNGEALLAKRREAQRENKNRCS
ncbi:MAG: hypothetical protein J6S50_05720 [Oscillospiraceae bacterium]|nr:hypothetical protein [Lachnospiraceae bacterium]MBO7727993.1 hypothetical protein [Oscillospiraceae bacterium]